MKKLLLLILILLQTGCILYIESSDGRSNDRNGGGTIYAGSQDIWIEYAEVDCDQGTSYYPTYWYLRANVDASYDYYVSEVDVRVYLDGGENYPMNYYGYNIWEKTLRSNYFMDCDDISYFNFVVEDAYGNYDELLVW